LNKKKLITLIGSICLILVFAALPFMAACPSPTPTPAEPITLRAVSFLPPFVAAMNFMGVWVERVNEQANGELVIDWLGGPEVIAPPDQAEAARTGAIDVVMANPSLYAAEIPVGVYFNLSEWTIMEERESASGFHDWMVELHETNLNCHYVGRGETNRNFVMWLREPVGHSSELTGLKGGGSPWMLRFMEDLGMAPVNVEARERYSGLERGVIDAGIQTIATGADLSYQEVAPYIIDVERVFRSGAITLIVNLDVWDSLPNHLQDLMDQVQIDMEAEMITWFEGKKEEARANLIAEGLEFIQLAPEDAAYYYDLAYYSTWQDAEQNLSPDDYAKLREVFIK